MTRRDVQHPPKTLKLKTAFADLVKSVGGPDEAEKYCRAHRRNLSDYTGRNTDCFAPADVIADLEEVAPEPLVTAALARRCNHVLVRLPEPGSIDAALTDTLAASVREHGEAIAACLSGNGDALAEIDQAIEALVQLRAIVRAAA